MRHAISICANALPASPPAPLLSDTSIGAVVLTKAQIADETRFGGDLKYQVRPFFLDARHRSTTSISLRLEVDALEKQLVLCSSIALRKKLRETSAMMPSALRWSGRKASYFSMVL